MDHFKGCMAIATALIFGFGSATGAEPAGGGKMPDLIDGLIFKQTSVRPEKAWYLAAIDPKAGFEEVEQAVAALLTPTEWELCESAGEVMMNRTKVRDQRRAALSTNQQANVTKALGQRLVHLLKSAPKGKLPDKAIVMASLLSRWDARAGRRPLARFLARIREIPDYKAPDDEFRMHSPDFSMFFQLLDELIFRNFSGADAAVRIVFDRSDYATLAEMSDDQDFLAILGNHPDNPEVAKILKAMFFDPKSEWHLSKATYAAATSYGNAGLLKSPLFKRALRTALEDRKITGTLTIKAETPGCCWIKWGNIQSGQGIEEGEPVGAKPGAKGMPVRHCDMLLEAIANCGSSDNPGPKFHIYWPLKQREAARKAWIEFLSGNQHS